MTATNKRDRLIRSLLSAPVRRCYSMHGCALCGKTIESGQYYADRGYGRRAHYECLPGNVEAHEPEERGIEL